MCASFPDGLADLFSDCLDGKNKPTTASLMKLLQEILAGFRHAYIVLDAIDECGEEDKLLSTIEEITNWELKNVHILATSRPHPVIKDRLSSRVSDAVDLQSALVDADIRLYIREHLQNDFRLKRWSLVVKEEIEKGLVEGANGM
jgi:ankyrin repeat domain-containing protein 50